MADLTIQDVRTRFPQYDELDDQSLADAVHSKFYGDMPKLEFYKKIGVADSSDNAGGGDQAVNLEVPTPPAPAVDPRAVPQQPVSPMSPQGAPSIDMSGLTQLMAPQSVAPPAPEPAIQPRPLPQFAQPAMPAPMQPGTDLTDDARAARGFGRSAALSGLMGAPAVPEQGGMIQPPAPNLAETEASVAPSSKDPDGQSVANVDAGGDRMRRLRLRQAQQRTRSSDQSEYPIMSQVNRGIADGVGGLVDFINPFDGDEFGISTGSAKNGLNNAMRSGGVEVAQGEPEGLMEQFARGAGEGVAAIVPAAKVLQVGQKAPGMVGAISQRLAPQAATTSGAITEAIATGTGRAAGDALETAGAPEWAQQTAEIAAPALALPALGATARGVAHVASNAPGAALARKTAQEIKRGVLPMTQQGAEEVAAQRLRGLVGGEERAADLGRQIETDNELGLTPAQQTGDPNLLGLEAQAARENPLLRERLETGKMQSRQAATEAIDSTSGDVADATGHFENRLEEFRKSLNAKAVWAKAGAGAGEAGTRPRGPETENSVKVVEAIQSQLDEALGRESDLWAEVPRGARVGTDNAKSAAQRIVENIPFAQREDVPKAISDILTSDVYADGATVNDMHGAYSKLRQVARAAMAGTDQNKNRARIANQVAEAILKDLGAVDGATDIGRKINEARAFSRTLHETFDQGTVGKVLNRTVDGDGSIAPETALARTVGRGGAVGKVSATDIERAAPKGGEGIQDYLRGRFSSTIRDASGNYTPKRAREWVRNNRELMDQYPQLREQFAQALKNSDNATAFAARADARIKLADKSSAAQFSGEKDGKAILSIIGADNPAAQAKSIVSTARKDASGKALAGVKAAFTDYLISGATSKDGVLSGQGLMALLKNRPMQLAMAQVFDPEEISRLRKISVQLSKIDAKPSGDVGDVMDSPANNVIEMAVRIAAARHGGNLGGGSMGGSIQTANIFTERARKALRNLTNDRARQLLMDAVEDPELFKELLRTPQSIRLDGPKRSRLAPYLIGATAAPEEMDDQ